MVDRIMAALAGPDHLARLQARESLDPGQVEVVLELLWGYGSANALAEAVRIVETFRRFDWLPRVRELLDPPQRPVRVLKAAVGCLGRLGDTASLQGVAQWVDHPNDMLRRAVVEAAGRLSGTAVLLRGLRDPAWQVRMYAAMGLGASREVVVAHAALAQAFEEESHPATAEQIVRAVAEVGGQGAAPALTQWLYDAALAPAVRRAAARGLGEIGRGDACVAALDDPDCRVAEQALWACRVGGRDGRS